MNNEERILKIEEASKLLNEGLHDLPLIFYDKYAPEIHDAGNSLYTLKNAIKNGYF